MISYAVRSIRDASDRESHLANTSTAGMRTLRWSESSQPEKEGSAAREISRRIIITLRIRVAPGIHQDGRAADVPVVAEFAAREGGVRRAGDLGTAAAAVAVDAAALQAAQPLN